MKTRMLVILAGLALAAGTGCDTLAGFFNKQSTKLIITNETDFVAGPKIRTSDSRNFVEDSYSAGTLLTGFGESGMLPPGASATITLDCAELETIVLDGASFEDATFGFPLGDTSDRKLLRRDVDFDCGDIVRIRLSGTLFNYNAAATVETNTSDADSDNTDDGLDGFGDLFGGELNDNAGDGSDSGSSNDDDDDEIADKLDELFN